MKKYYIFLLIVIMSTTMMGCGNYSNVGNEDNSDFRNACWGDSVDDAMKTEKWHILKVGKDYLLSEGDLAGFDVYAVYQFDDNKLYNGTYRIEEKLKDGTEYLNAYNKWHEILEKKYGSPSSDSPGKMYSEERYAKENLSEVEELEAGHTLYAELWETERTRITLYLGKRNDDVLSVFLTYDDKNVDIDEKRELDGF